MKGIFAEGGAWTVAFTLTQRNNMRTNQKNYWGTP